MKLNKESYHSKEAGLYYMSNSQFNDFELCEAKALAKISGIWEDITKECMLEGLMFHAWNEGVEAYAKFISDHPEIISSTGKTKGELKAGFKQIEKMIDCIKNDEFAMYFLNDKGVEKEKIITGEIDGVLWKGMIDCYYPEKTVEIKTVKSITEKYWVEELRSKINFIEKNNYIRQAAIYSFLCGVPTAYMLAVSKEEYPDKGIFKLDVPGRFEHEIEYVKSKQKRYVAVKNGKEVAIGCNTCNYCRSVKKLSVESIKSFQDL